MKFGNNDFANTSPDMWLLIRVGNHASKRGTEDAMENDNQNRTNGINTYMSEAKLTFLMLDRNISGEICQYQNRWCSGFI